MGRPYVCKDLPVPMVSGMTIQQEPVSSGPPGAKEFCEQTSA